MASDEQTIWKFPLDITDVQVVETPTQFEPLHVGLDPQGVPCLWGLVRPGSHLVATAGLPATTEQIIHIVGTGNPADHVTANRHLGSFVQGPFVWHVFHAGGRRG